MSAINLGTQKVSFDYKQPAKAEEFNQVLRNLIKPGIYSGGTVTHVGNDITLAPFRAYFDCANNTTMGVSVFTTQDVVQTATINTKDYFVMSYSWSNSVENWVDFSFKSSAELVSSDIIIAVLTFSGASVISVSTALQTKGLYNENYDAFFTDDVTITGDLNIGGTVNIVGDITNYVRDTALREGCMVYSNRIGTTLTTHCLPNGKIYIQAGRIEVNRTLVEVATATEITISGGTSSRWYLIYISDAGVISTEATTDAVYGTMPIAEINSKAPLNTLGTARYKSGDATNRLIACAYVMPTQTAWSNATTYVKGQLASDGTTIYISLQNSNNNHAVSDASWWSSLGENGAVWAPLVFNFPEPVFGSGWQGDITLTNGQLLEAGRDWTLGTRCIEFPYEYKNVTIATGATVDIGRSAAAAVAIPAPVSLKVKETLLFEGSGAQLNGSAKGISGGAGGTKGGNYGGAGGAGASSGYPFHLTVKNIVDRSATTAYAINNTPGNGSDGANGTNNGTYFGGGGGGGGASTSGLKLTYKNYINDFSGNVATNALLSQKIAKFSNIFLIGTEAGGVSATIGVGYLVGDIRYGSLGGGKGGSGIASVGSGGSGGVVGSGGAIGILVISGGPAGGAGGAVGVYGSGGVAGGGSANDLGGGGGGGGLGAGGGGGGDGQAGAGSNGSAPAASHLQAGGYFIIQQIGTANDEVLV